jgi:hypothetical protein
MKSRDSILRLKHFQVEDKTRQLTQIDLMIGEFSKMAEDLDNQIRIEEQKAGITDPSHFAYPTFAKAARQRRDNLAGSIRDLKEKRVAAVHALADAEEQLKKAQLMDSRDASGAADAVIDKQIERRAMIG